MGKVLARHFNPVAVVARGRNGRIGEFHHAHGLTHAPKGLLNRYGPRSLVWFQATRTHFTVNSHQITGDSQAIQAMGQLVHPKAFGDA